MWPHEFQEWLHTYAEQEFGHSSNSGPVNALDLSTESSIDICI